MFTVKFLAHLYSNDVIRYMGVDPWVDRGTCPPTFRSGGDALCFVPLLFWEWTLFVMHSTDYIHRRSGWTMSWFVTPTVIFWCSWTAGTLPKPSSTIGMSQAHMYNTAAVCWRNAVTDRAFLVWCTSTLSDCDNILHCFLTLERGSSSLLWT